jgi:hypothetical protein
MGSRTLKLDRHGRFDSGTALSVPGTTRGLDARTQQQTSTRRRRTSKREAVSVYCRACFQLGCSDNFEYGTLHYLMTFFVGLAETIMLSTASAMTYELLHAAYQPMAPFVGATRDARALIRCIA